MTVKKILGISIIILSGIDIGFAQKTEDLMSMSLEDILNMNIFSVSKQAENIFESPLSASVITREDILNSGVTTLEEALRLAPGLIVREESHGNYDIHIRGMDNIPPGNFTSFSENTMTLVMIDGRKVFNHLNGGTFWETLPIGIDEIERIEIIRGPAASLYGPNAVTGVIHFITREAHIDKSGISGNITQGHPNSSIGELNAFYKPRNNMGMKISAIGEQRERFQDTYHSYLHDAEVPYDSLRPYRIDPSTDQGYPEIKDKNISKKRWSSTIRLNWDISKSIKLDISGGYQDSRAQTVFMETFATPLSIRTSKTSYANINATIYGFQLQISGQTGIQDMKENFKIVSKFDMRMFDGNLEYAWEKGPLKLRPGMSWQEVMYKDTPYLTPEQLDMGYLNAERTLSNYAYFLRTEYQPVNPVRIIAALRTDYYNYPDTAYINYQLAATYRINGNNIIRGVYSRANRGPFFMDIYTDVSEYIDEKQIEYLGNRNLRLPLTDMAEIGFRSRLSKRVQMDIELYYSTTRDLTSLDVNTIGYIENQPSNFSSLGYIYHNIRSTARQMGITGNFSITLSQSLKSRFYGSIQKTELEDFGWKTSPFELQPEEGSLIHKNTPAFYGGLLLTYHPSHSWTVNGSIYYLGSHMYRHDYASIDEANGEIKLKSRLIPAIHVRYKFFKENSVYFTLKNFITDQREFGFAESTGLSIFGGFRWAWAKP
ncbi:TonB-dependent receptor plug domain-containing protein [bacterium]|nr:TonB-dependent receptor plug domain-containing protein [bacterium]